MREDLALKHLLLIESRKLVKDAEREGKLEVAQALSEISNTLVIEYHREAQIYTIKTICAEKEIKQEIGKKEFAFYQRADSEKSPVKVSNYQPGEDPIAALNQQKATDIVKQLLSEIGLTSQPQAINDSHSESKRATRIERLAWEVVILIALASAALTYYQGTRTFNLIDNTYTLEAAWRILNGEVPYRDFNLIVAPGIYLKQALLMKLFGARAIVGLWWCMGAMFLTVLLTYLILKLIDTPRWLAVALCLIAAAGGNVVRPNVWYDVDALLFCLASAALFLWSEKRTSLCKYLFPLGFLTALPLIFKQNLGAAHLVIITGIVYAQWIFYPHRFRVRRALSYHLGIIAALSLIIIPFWYLNALPQLFRHTFVLPSQLRGEESLLSVLWTIYPSIPHTTDFPFYSAAFLTWGAMALGVVFWFVGTHRNIFLMLMPVWIFFLSLSGLYALKSASVFPLMPLLAILIALTRLFFTHFAKLSKWSNAACYPLTVLVATVLLLHALAGYQLYFFYDNVFEQPTPFKTARLRGMSASPEVVAGIDAVVDFIEQLPPEETIAMFPTEDPVYFLTNRKSPIKILQRYYDSGGDPNTRYLPELQRVNPDWVIVKTTLQCKFYNPLTSLEVGWIKTNYKEVHRLEQYLIWKRVEHGKS